MDTQDRFPDWRKPTGAKAQQLRNNLLDGEQPVCGRGMPVVMPGGPPSGRDKASTPPRRSVPPGAGTIDGEAIERVGLAGQLLTARVPLWLVLILVILVAVIFGVLLLSRQEVDLGGAVDGAVEASVSVVVCNETVDRRQMNPRTEELAFEDGLRALGAREANVMVKRIDCGPDGP